MFRRRLSSGAIAIAMLLLISLFAAPGASGATATTGLDPDPIILKLHPSETPFLWMGARLTDSTGTPLVNEIVWFSLGAPYDADGVLRKGGQAFCGSYTTSTGHADCPGEFLGNSLLAILTGAYASYFVPGHPELYRSVRMPLIATS